MAKSAFQTRMDNALKLDDPPPQQYVSMRQRLDEVVDLLQQRIDRTGAKAQVALEPGHLVNAGQQFNVVVHIPKRNHYKDTLFRAYLPASGTPVTLDFIGDEPETARTANELETLVIEFLSLDPIRRMIQSLREIAASIT